MSPIRSLSAALIGAALSLSSCSGRGSDAGRLQTPPCADPQANTMCLTSCSLGCESAQGCQITEIAQNQPLIFTFNQPLDPATVDSASVSLRATNGEPAVGQLRVIGERIEFVPELQVIGGVGFFGFRPSLTYALTLQGGTTNGSAIRSTTGDPLQRSVNCMLSVSLGVVDLNGAPPAAQLLLPQQRTAAPTDTVIRLEFSEAIDGTPFSGAGGGTGPIRVSARRAVEAAGGGLECSSIGAFQPISGRQQLNFDLDRGVAVWTFVPSTPLPTGTCVRVEVTSNVRDLAGVAAPDQRFEFLTAAASGPPGEIRESFDDDRMRDPATSSGAWSNGRATFGPIGGRGVHGVFDITDGTDLGGGVFEWSTDDQRIRNPEAGGAVRVRDGRFEFAEFSLAAGQTLRFVGSNPAVIRSAGMVQVLGTIDVSGVDTRGSLNGSNLIADPTGAPGGAGGAAGGDGALAGDGIAHRAAYDGRPGGDLRVAAAHAYAAATADTGGRGSRQFPLDGRNASLRPGGLTLTFQLAAGGGGGGFASRGEPGRAILSDLQPQNPAWLGPDAAGGGAFDLLGTLGLPTGASSLEHFLVGGSGGGGGGSHAVFSPTSPSAPKRWQRGDGGAGGGGALALRAGGALSLGPGAALLARGGAASAYSGNIFQTAPAPGGGGSGGSLLLQSAAPAGPLEGVLDVRGGTGGLLEGLQSALRILDRGGDGSPGIARLEIPGGAGGDPMVLMPGADPATSASIGELRDRDDAATFTSRFYFTGQEIGPTYLYYVIEARVGGAAVTFSDDPTLAATPAVRGRAPIHCRFQGADLDPVSLEPVGAIDGPFRDLVGRRSGANAPALADDATNGFRFRITIDRSQGLDVEIDEVRVVFRQ